MHQSRAPRSAPVRVCLLYTILLMMLAVPMLANAQAGQADNSSPDATNTSDSVSLNRLADIIANDKTRDQLVADLRQAASAQGAPAAKEQAAAKPEDSAADQAPAAAAVKQHKAASREHVSFARRFATMSAAWSETISTQAVRIWHTLKAVVVGNGKQTRGAQFDASLFFAASIALLSVILATIVAFVVLGFLASRVYAAIDRFSSRASAGSAFVIRRGTAITMAVLVDILVLSLAGGVGYLAGLYAVGDAGAIGTRSSLFINAFILIELSKVVIRAFFADRYDSLRLLNIPADIAAWWSIRLRVFVSIIGYGVLVAVPIINAQLSFTMGAVLSFLITGGSYIYALTVIFGNRTLLTERLMHRANSAEAGVFGVLYRLLARLWVLIALIYFTALFVSSQVDPLGALPYMMSATFQTVVVAAIGFSLSNLLGRAIGRRLTFSDSLRDKLPMFEARVNAYVPNGLKVIRVVILLVAAALVANAWAVFNLAQWLSSDAGLTTVSVAVKLAIILGGAALFWLLAASIIEHRLSPQTGRGAPTPRQETLLILFRNTLAILITTFTLMIALSQIGVDIGPLIAGAGVFGLAIGFGAQTLVKDIITGVFIQLENAMNTGDVVNLGGTWGTVERLTIRSVSLRDIDGGFHIIPFSSVATVSNYMREFAYHRSEYRIAYREDIDNAIYYLREAFAELKSNSDHAANILEDMAVPGVTELDENCVKIRVMIKTLPGGQWGVGRAFNRLVKIHFDRAGIEIPFPHQTLWFGENHDGHAPSANLRIIDDDDGDDGDENAPKRLKKRRRGDDAAPPETGDAPG